jgi:hypothetical protein
MASKRSHEGYLLIDHTDSPGVPDSLSVAAGLPAGAGRGKFECATLTCQHCDVQVLVNPKRNRERAWCKHCDHYLCDACGVALQHTGECRNASKRITEYLAAVERGEHPLILR